MKAHTDAWNNPLQVTDEAEKAKLDKEMELARQTAEKHAEANQEVATKRQEEQQKSLDEWNQRLQNKQEQDRKLRQLTERSGDLYRKL
jgi:hypothetical protein